jgi:hypothetical protein
MTMGGHIITVTHHKRLQTYIVGEADRGKAIAILASELKQPILEPLAPVFVPPGVLKDHAVKPGHAKRLHL